ncbi:hypothetical protein AQ490_07195 [Wenjunlia vitaminophila]|uniref:Uncharacterized protein n=1 Tax=Wenjunlia vitaminophila TaxID=76728 RepID=A0A0T6LMA8_WENVI|nr:hypothetical protein [Wenjunlia vitaminophila]KRV47255.1 hypothetical protein AQ490_07195 [Wenjunlia vitaminophila]
MTWGETRAVADVTSRHHGPSPGPGLTVGMVVYDRRWEMPATIVGFDGPFVCLTRPTGLTWRARRASLRPATTRERRQLRAIAVLHARSRGDGAVPPGSGAH